MLFVIISTGIINSETLTRAGPSSDFLHPNPLNIAVNKITAEPVLKNDFID